MILSCYNFKRAAYAYGLCKGMQPLLQSFWLMHLSGFLMNDFNFKPQRCSVLGGIHNENSS